MSCHHSFWKSLRFHEVGPAAYCRGSSAVYFAILQRNNTHVPTILSWFNYHAGGYADTPGANPRNHVKHDYSVPPWKILILLPYYYVRFVRSFVRSYIYYIIMNERTNERTKVLNYYRWDFPADRFDESSWWHLPKKPTRLFSMARRTTERVASISPPPTKQTVLSEHDFKTSLTHEKFEQTEIALLRKKLSVVVSAFNTEIQKHENELKTVWYNDPAPHYNCWEHAVHSGHFSLTRRNVV